MAEYARKKVRLDRERAMELYEKGADDEEIAELLYVHIETVRRWRRSLKLPKIKGQMKKKKLSRIAELAAEARAHGMNYGMYMATIGGKR